MGRVLAFDVALVGLVSVLWAAQGCSSTQNGSAGYPGAGEDATATDAGEDFDAGDSGFVPSGPDLPCLSGGVFACNPGGFASPLDTDAAETSVEDDASTDSNIDAMSVDSGVGDAWADSCARNGCAASCVDGTHNVSTVVNGCVVWQCCVPDDAGADAATDSAADAGACGACGIHDITQVCVEHLTVGGVRIPPDDAGGCSGGRVILPEAPDTCSLPPMFSCDSLPAACFPAGAVRPANCVCAPSLCTTGAACKDVSPTLVICTLAVP